MRSPALPPRRLITLLILRGKHKVRKISFTHPPVVSPFLVQNFLLSTFFHNTFLNLCSSLTVRRVCSVINSTEHIPTAEYCSYLAEEVLALYEIQSFAAIQMSAHHWTVPSARRIHSASS
jgi:hypothetical protein